MKSKVKNFMERAREHKVYLDDAFEDELKYLLQYCVDGIMDAYELAERENAQETMAFLKVLLRIE